ncbi:MAG TPA: V-type ATP synthase subunit E family protein [Verrucomicrobiae bacterium]|nr:V-type ATP synthase subunit E family protein [Verrucomicrobiae bacterium]
MAENSPETLCAEIRAEANRRRDDILRRAKTEAESILATAKNEAETIRRKQREQTRAEAARRRKLTLATVALETGRLRTARIESLLESVREEIRRRLAVRNFDVRASVIALSIDAIRQMRNNNYLVKISTTDYAAFGAALADEIAQYIGDSGLKIKVQEVASVADGCIVESSDRSQMCDNRLPSRLERLWPELRRQIAIHASLTNQNNSNGGNQ